MRMTTKRQSRTSAGRFRGGKLHPSLAVAFKAGEGGLLTQTATIELDPVAGRLITPTTGEMFAVYVPVQAMMALKYPTDDTAGITEVIRQRYLDGAPLFDLVNESDVSKRMSVKPRSIGGVKKVSEAVVLAHTCAVNYLRQRKYTYAALLSAPHGAVTPALYSSTVLERFNAVLDPDDHVNGMIDLTLTETVAPVLGIGPESPPQAASVTDAYRETGGASPNTKVFSLGSIPVLLKEDPGRIGYPLIQADLAQVSAGGFSLTDLYNAETMDRLTRAMRAVIDANPVDGEDQIVRWAHGLRVDDAQTPFLLFSREVVFGQDMLKATDGAGIESEVTQSRLMTRISMTVPVPQTELGGIVVTFLTVKPDEVLKDQPDPDLSDVWVFDNYMAQELNTDPVPVYGRDVQADVAQASETAVMFYTGFNELKRTYVQYGWNGAVDPATIDAKNAMWQIEIPASVTPSNIVYPEDIDHFPFVDQTAEIARYMLSSSLVGKSPMFVGPSPVETVSVIESEDLFEESET